MIGLEITTHEGQTFHVELEEYDPITLNEKINNQDINTLQIGELIISRVSIKTVFPVREDDQA